MKNSKPLNSPSVSVAFEGVTLDLRFNPQDVVTEVSVWGDHLPVWAEELSHFLQNKSLHEIEFLDWSFLDSLEEKKFLSLSRELVKTALNIYQGKMNDLHDEVENPLICRCFGVYEAQVIEYLKSSEAPTLEDMSEKLKAGSGCRSCRSQLKKWIPSMTGHSSENSSHPKDFLLERSHYYLNRPNSDWILEIDLILSRFPLSQSWKMEVSDFHLGLVTISYDREVSQEEEERVGEEVQDFLNDYILHSLLHERTSEETSHHQFSFFLVRRRQRSKTSS